MSEITSFPWAFIKTLRVEEVALRNRLARLYQITQGNEDLIRKIVTAPLTELVKTEVFVECVNLVPGGVSQFAKGVATELLMGIIALEPLGKRAVVTFDASFAKLMVQRVLAGESFDPSTFFKMEIRAISPLEEAVIQYILISLIDRFMTQTQPKNLRVTFDLLLNNSEKFSTIFSTQESLVMLNLRVRLFEHDYFIKCYLPLDATQDLPALNQKSTLLPEGIRRLGSFSTALQLEIAQVTLNISELRQLQIGDILLFDEAQIAFHEGAVSGRASLVFVDCEERRGYTVDLISDCTGVRAKLVAVM